MLQPWRFAKFSLRPAFARLPRDCIPKIQHGISYTNDLSGYYKQARLGVGVRRKRSFIMMTQDLLQTTTSYSRGADHPPLIDLCIGEILDQVAARYPESPALILRGEKLRFNWRELQAEVERTARGLMALGFERGDRVGIWATNVSQWVLMQFGTAKMGAVLVNLNLRFRAHELEFVLKQSGCKGLVMQHAFRDCDYVETLRQLAPELDHCAPGELLAAQLPDLRHAIYLGENPPAGMLSWNAMLAQGESIAPAELRAREASLKPRDTINIQYTSGTTGQPKGAELSHHNVANNGCFIGDSMKLTADDLVCIPVPFYHCFGMVLGNMACLTHGSAMVIPADFFDPLATMQTIHEERCTAVYGVPTMFISEFAHPRFKRIRFHLAAHRYHGGLALSHRTDAARHPGNALQRTHHLLRPHRNLAGHHPEHHR